MTAPGRLLVGTIGYRNLRDHSAGFEVLDRLAATSWPADVTFEDISYNPIAVVQRLEDDAPADRFTRAIIIAAVPRAGRTAGRVTAYRWDNVLPSPELIQHSVSEGVTGVINLDNSLIICRHFGGLPDDVVVIEIEPEAHEFGDALTPVVQQAVTSVCAIVTRLVGEPDAWPSIPAGPLGGPADAAEPARPTDVLEDVDRLLTVLQSHPDATVGAQVTELLQGIDAVHRAGLTHLMTLVRGMAGEAFVNRLVADPAIRLLLMSYDLVPIDRRMQAEEAIDAVRGHLHSRGVDVELLDVVGGVIYARLHGLAAAGVTEDAVRRDLEEALSAGLLGFQELVLRPREAARPASPVIQIQGIRGLRRPAFRRALAAAELAPESMKAVELDGHSVLIANVGGDIYAVVNRCVDTALPLEFGALRGAEVVCSWHGCRYDVRSGKRIDVDGPRLQVFPVAVEDDEIRIALDVEPAVAGR